MKDINPPAIVKANMAELEQLAAQINSAHDSVLQSHRKTLEHAKEAGKLLLKAMEKIPYGKKAEWIANNVKFARNTAWRYMKVAKEDFTCSIVEQVDESFKVLTAEVSDPFEEERSPEIEQEVAPFETRKPGNFRDLIQPPKSHPATQDGVLKHSFETNGTELEPPAIPVPSGPRIPARIQKFFDCAAIMKDAAAKAKTLARMAREIEDNPAYLKTWQGRKRIVGFTHVMHLGKYINAAIPLHPCPECKGVCEPAGKGQEPCKSCKDKGYQTIEDTGDEDSD